MRPWVTIYTKKRTQIRLADRCSQLLGFENDLVLEEHVAGDGVEVGEAEARGGIDRVFGGVGPVQKILYSGVLYNISDGFIMREIQLSSKHIMPNKESVKSEGVWNIKTPLGMEPCK